MKSFEYGGKNFVVFDEVYFPREDSFLLLKNIDASGAETMLELGCGCGLLSVFLADALKKVVAVDINPFAVENTRLNAEKNGAGNVFVYESDLFSKIKESFDLICMNPPYVPMSMVEGQDSLVDLGELALSWDGGADGRGVLDRFLESFPRHLKSGGKAFFVQSSLNGYAETRLFLEKQGFSCEKKASEKLEFEEIAVFEATRL